MIVSEARREANRRNAQRSTGPKTEEGKERSRRNALTHGLSAEVVRLPEDDAAVGAVAGSAAADGGSGALPAGWPSWLGEEVAAITSKLGRCDRLDEIYRKRVVLRAEYHWDDDRRLEVEFLGSGIARDPAGVARELRMSPQGCDWMIDRWSRLARAADREGSWTPEQTAIAFDLLGTPRDFRDGSPGDPIDLEAKSGSDLDPSELARREVAALTRRKEQVAGSDAFERSVAQADAGGGYDSDLRKLRRHEADLHRRLRWCVAQLAKAEAAPPDRSEPAPRPPADPRATFGPGLDAPSDGDLYAEMESIMAQATALRRGLAPTPQPSAVQATPSPTRPDPRVALGQAREAARRDKRDRRQG